MKMGAMTGRKEEHRHAPLDMDRIGFMFLEFWLPSQYRAFSASAKKWATPQTKYKGTIVPFASRFKQFAYDDMTPANPNRSATSAHFLVQVS